MKNFFLKNQTLGLVMVAVLLTALIMPVMGSIAHAQYGTQAPEAPETVITDVNSVFELINNVFNILFWLLIALAAIFIIMAAFSYLTAGGDPEKIKIANQKVIYAAVAVVVGVLAKAIPRLVCSFISTGCE